MEYHPFSLFVKVADLTPGEQADLANRLPSTLDGVGFTVYADLYRAVANVMSPAEVDECELWQVLALLSIDRKGDPDDPLARIAASIQGGDGPVDVTAQIMAAQGISTR